MGRGGARGGVYLCLFVFAFAFARAENIYASPVGEGTECGARDFPCSLAAAIEKSTTNDFVLLSAGFYEENTLFINSKQITISNVDHDEVVITTVKDSFVPQKLFHVTNSNLTFSGITFEHCLDTCIFIETGGTTLIEFCTFQHNGENANSGSAINSNSYLEIYDSTFQNNILYSENALGSTVGTATIHGGAVFATEAKLIRCEFLDNGILFNGQPEERLIYAYGGAISILESGSFTECTFRNNSISSGFFYYASGGAIRCPNIVSNSNIFRSNYAETTGSGGGSTSTTNSRFATGGAITADTSVVAYNSTFENNSAYSSGYGSYGGSFGGAINGGIVNITICSFMNNLASTEVTDLWEEKCSGNSNGGAIYGSYVKINESTFENNGAIAFTSDFDSDIDTTAIAGAVIGIETLTSFNSIYSKNFVFSLSPIPTAFGGATSGWEASFRNCEFSNNTAPSGGAFGCLMNNSDRLLMDHCSFLSNKATENGDKAGGGAVYILGSNLNNFINLTYSSFSGNDAYAGGDIYLEMVSYSLDGSSYEEIYISDSTNIGMIGTPTVSPTPMSSPSILMTLSPESILSNNTNSSSSENEENPETENKNSQRVSRLVIGILVSAGALLIIFCLVVVVVAIIVVVNRNQKRQNFELVNVEMATTGDDAFGEELD